jgi:DNA-binding NarL/FixJ family response regulator
LEQEKKILIAVPHPDMLEGVRVLLKDMFDVILMVTDVKSLSLAVAGIRPDLVIADLSLPVIAGDNVARLLQRLDPELTFIILSSHDEPTVIDECLAAGAKGYVLRRLTVLDLIPAVEAVLGGNTYVTSSVMRERPNANRQSWGW